MPPFCIRLCSPFVGPWPLFQITNLIHTFGRTPWTGDQPVARPLPIHAQTSTPPVGFEPTIPVFAYVRKKRAPPSSQLLHASMYCSPETSDHFLRITRQHFPASGRSESSRLSKLYKDFDANPKHSVDFVIETQEARKHSRGEEGEGQHNKANSINNGKSERKLF
jgi:hypothetical protein